MASVDVGIPCYQYGRYLRDCVTSVLTQDIADLRVLIIDNASTDDSLEVARQLAAEDPRIEVIAHQKNLGSHASYNEAVDWAEADYFLLLDADDLLAPGCLARAVAIMEAHPEVSFTCGTEGFLLPDGTVRVFERNYQSTGWSITSGEDYITRLCRTSTNTVAASSVVRRTSAQKKAGHYRPELPYSDDVELWMRLATFGHVARTPAVQAIRRLHPLQHGASYTASIVRDFKEREAAFESFFANEGARMPECDLLLARAKRSLGEHAYWAALARLGRGQMRLAGQLLRFSIAHKPSVVAAPPFGWLLRANRVADRVREVLMDAVASRFGLSKSSRGGSHGISLQLPEFQHEQLRRVGSDGIGAK
jgi:glycosyltransferase involved in cell wall biosynthesis